jgi:antitoxin ParD1/3/4
MVISLHPELEQFITRLVRTGQFKSPEAAVAEAVLRMKERDEKMTWLRSELQKGIDELDRGEATEWDVEEVKAKLREKYPNFKG